MFRKFFVLTVAMVAGGYVWAEEPFLPQVVTSEVYYTEETEKDTGSDKVEYTDTVETVQQDVVESRGEMIPVWPIVGSDADVTAVCGNAGCSDSADGIKIVSKIGSNLVVENNFNVGDGTGWTGGANMLHGTQIPVGFDNECEGGSEMPLLHREVLEDDGGNVLAVSRSGRKKCNRYVDGYDAYLAKNGLKEKTSFNAETGEQDVLVVDAGVRTDFASGDEIVVDLSADAEPATATVDAVRSWVVANGQTLREVLQNWCDKEGWDLVWVTPLEYPIQASAVFKGRFVDVASAVVRNFARAIPAPYAKFYKGNRVLVVSAYEE